MVIAASISVALVLGACAGRPLQGVVGARCTIG